MLRVFISYYAGAEDNIVAALVDRSLEAKGIMCWKAPRKIRLGDIWQDQIDQAIESCNLMILVWSENANSSPYVNRELRMAERLEKRIIPCVLPNAELPVHLNDRQYIRFEDPDGGLDKLLEDLQRLEEEEFTTEPELPSFVRVEAGTFTYSVTGIACKVVAFEMADFTVTLGQYKRFDPSHRQPNIYGPDLDPPVCNVSWDHAVRFCSWLTARTDFIVKLPSEIQWEFAAKAGNELEYATTDGRISPGSCNCDNIERSSTPKTFYQAQKPSGLYDMSGNVWEWCEDEDKDRMLKDYRIVRGGSWIDPPQNCKTTSRHSFHRSHANLFTGFRVIRVPK